MSAGSQPDSRPRPGTATAEIVQMPKWVREPARWKPSSTSGSQAPYRRVSSGARLGRQAPRWVVSLVAEQVAAGAEDALEEQRSPGSALGDLPGHSS